MDAHLKGGMAHLIGDRASLVTPLAATHRCFDAFCLNDPFARATSEFNGFNTLADGVCELKTFDVRAIGFFWRQGSYIVTNIQMRKDLKPFAAYQPFIQEAKNFMSSLGLDPPLCVKGVKYVELF
jgi:hypothetical protein